MDLGEPSKIIGIKISCDDKSITISQKLYIESILKWKGLDHTNQVRMLLDSNVHLESSLEGNNDDQSNAFTQSLGALQFVANTTRSDIAYAVNKLASYTANLTIQHVTALKRIMCYLSGTWEYGIRYYDSPIYPNAFIGYSDAAFANNEDYKSISSYVFITQGGAITWRSKKQTTIALSSMKAKYVGSLNLHTKLVG